jgi:hypothetical protein
MRLLLFFLAPLALPAEPDWLTPPVPLQGPIQPGQGSLLHRFQSPAPAKEAVAAYEKQFTARNVRSVTQFNGLGWTILAQSGTDAVLVKIQDNGGITDVSVSRSDTLPQAPSPAISGPTVPGPTASYAKAGLPRTEWPRWFPRIESVKPWRSVQTRWDYFASAEAKVSQSAPEILSFYRRALTRQGFSVGENQVEMASVLFTNTRAWRSMRIEAYGPDPDNGRPMTIRVMASRSAPTDKDPLTLQLQYEYPKR